MVSCLIKIAINQLLIISSIITFSIDFNFNFTYLFYVSSPALANSYNLDCFLADITGYIDIIYVRIFVNLLIPLLYINVYFLLYIICVLMKKIAYVSHDFYTPAIYMFVIT